MRPRLVPGIPFPQYTFVPGRSPHPHSDPLGHHFGQNLPDAQIPDPERWADSLHYLLGLDLFNHGYYWEAHESWESLWHACGRRGPLATFFKALIQWAVVGVKVREHIPEGALTHARRAKELFEETVNAVAIDAWMGFSLRELIVRAEVIIKNPPTERESTASVEIVFPFELIPSASRAP